MDMAEEKNLARFYWESAVEENDFAKADRFYRKLQKEEQLDYELCFVMGLWYRQMGELAFAAEAFAHALMFAPNDYETYYEIANTMREMGKEELAEQYYRYSLSLKPNHIDTLYCLGQVLAGQDRTEEAETYFCKALQLTTCVEEMITLAVEFSAIGNADQAIHIYMQGLLMEPDNFYLYSNIGIELAEQGEYRDAIFCHEKAIQMAPENADIWYNAACAYALMNEPMRALLALEQAVQLDPENRNYAMQDAELECLHKHKRFWKLVKE